MSLSLFEWSERAVPGDKLTFHTDNKHGSKSQMPDLKIFPGTMERPCA